MRDTMASSRITVTCNACNSSVMLSSVGGSTSLIAAALLRPLDCNALSAAAVMVSCATVSGALTCSVCSFDMLPLEALKNALHKGALRLFHIAPLFRRECQRNIIIRRDLSTSAVCGDGAVLQRLDFLLLRRRENQ